MIHEYTDNITVTPDAQRRSQCEGLDFLWTYHCIAQAPKTILYSWKASWSDAPVHHNGSVGGCKSTSAWSGANHTPVCSEQTTWYYSPGYSKPEVQAGCQGPNNQFLNP